MKRFIVIFLILALCLAGCSTPPVEESTPPAPVYTATPEPTPEPTPIVVTFTRKTSPGWTAPPPPPPLEEPLPLFCWAKARRKYPI